MNHKKHFYFLGWLIDNFDLGDLVKSVRIVEFYKMGFTCFKILNFVWLNDFLQCLSLNIEPKDFRRRTRLNKEEIKYIDKFHQLWSSVEISRLDMIDNNVKTKLSSEPMPPWTYCLSSEFQRLFIFSERRFLNSIFDKIFDDHQSVVPNEYPWKKYPWIHRNA